MKLALSRIHSNVALRSHVNGCERPADLSNLSLQAFRLPTSLAVSRG
jgi:hypothetical protein